MGAKPAGLGGNVELDELQQRRFGLRIAVTTYNARRIKGVTSLCQCCNPSQRICASLRRKIGCEIIVAFLGHLSCPSREVFPVQSLQVWGLPLLRWEYEDVCAYVLPILA